MAKTFSFPSGHWNWPVALSHQHAVRAGSFIFTGGQVDLDAAGNVQNLNNLAQQCANAMNYLSDLLADLGAGFNDLVRLVVYYVGGEAEKTLIQQWIAEAVGADARPVINMIRMPELCYPDMLIEIEGVAMRASDGSRLPKDCFCLESLPSLHAGFSHVVRCGDTVFTSDMAAISPAGEVIAAGDIAEQTRIMMANLVTALAAAGASTDDVLKINAFFTQGTDEASWSVPAKIRADHFADPGPAVTGIPLKQFPHAGQMTQISATASYGTGGGSRTYAWPEGHWDWSSPLPYKHGNRCGQLIHIGGQVSLDPQANVIDPGNMVAQTRTAMANIEKVLAELGAELSDVVKVTTFYEGGASAEDLHKNLCIRSDSYAADRGPATTGIPVPGLIYDDMVIEIEVIAVVD